jgi:hypothetical protein
MRKAEAGAVDDDNCSDDENGDSSDNDECDDVSDHSS